MILRVSAPVMICAGLVIAGFGTASPAGADSWTMPNLIGKDLQGAQDTIQSLTSDAIWYSSSTDLTGKGRMQIDDRNWVVCTSTPAPGAAITQSTKIDFGVVKKDTESCP
ncbi:hypothetical protein ACGFK1_29115 [Mycobacterium sp. NPDC048908]|uniref:hypothetical protein n=1 Tax=Mycobacterium sp. NPDC048908 TaxID=3364292 RepID=UPI00371B7A65